MTDFRMSGRVQQVGAGEFLAIVTAVPENGDHGQIRTLSQLLPSLLEAKQIAAHLMRRMGEVVVRIEGRITAVETDGI